VFEQRVLKLDVNVTIKQANADVAGGKNKSTHIINQANVESASVKS